MGADARMHDGIRSDTFHIASVSWGAPPPGPATLANLAAACIRTHAITADDWVGGSSFGGMVAAEVALQVPVRGLVLFGSCTHPRFISPSLRHAARWGHHVPFAPMLASSGAFTSLSGGSLLSVMFTRTDPHFLSWACRALAGWRGVTVNVPCWRIHGSADRVITARGQPIDRIVPGAGHVVAMTHAGAVRAFLERITGI
jgi:pimeloyl-ACP methyl ester carboxylesterase